MIRGFRLVALLLALVSFGAGAPVTSRPAISR